MAYCLTQRLSALEQLVQFLSAPGPEITPARESAETKAKGSRVAPRMPNPQARASSRAKLAKPMAKKSTHMCYLRPHRRHPVEASAPPPFPASGTKESTAPVATASAVGASDPPDTDTDRTSPALEAVLPRVLPGPPPAIVSPGPPASPVTQVPTCVTCGGKSCPATQEVQAQFTPSWNRLK